MPNKLMLIGIDGSRAFIKNRTGIEEYSYQVIKHLRNELGENQASLPMRQVVLYVRQTDNLQLITDNKITTINDLVLPENWSVKTIRFPRFWTQIGLSFEMLMHPVDTLFVPAHTVPFVHPENTVVVVHGLEYEFCPESYSFWDRIYMRASIKNSCAWAKRIISVSNNTKKDLIGLYKVPEDKIEVIHEGYDSHQFCFKLIPGTSVISNQKLKPLNSVDDRLLITDDKYFLFVGRIEERKNIINIIKAFEILKEKYGISHKLILAGKPGFGYKNVKSQMSKIKCCDDIFELGFVNEDEKWKLLKEAEVFVFPTLYEGFGLPILEAQSLSCPVVSSNNSSITEVAEKSAVLVDPQNPEDIAEGIFEIISNETLKNDIIVRGLENVKRFSWKKCAESIAEILVKKN